MLSKSLLIGKASREINHRYLSEKKNSPERFALPFRALKFDGCKLLRNVSIVVYFAFNATVSIQSMFQSCKILKFPEES